MKFFLTSFFDVGFYRWELVLFYGGLALIFIYGVLRPTDKTEWRSAGMASGWVIALYAEMYGIPLTLYILSSIFGPHMGASDFQNGHIWAPLFFSGNPQWNLFFTVLGQLLIAAGGILALIGWRHLWQKREDLVTHGIYRYTRHPQYSGFFLFILGSMLNWPTLITLTMAPILLFTYYKLALQEEKLALEKFGAPYQEYINQTNRFWPKWSKKNGNK